MSQPRSRALLPALALCLGAAALTSLPAAPATGAPADPMGTAEPGVTVGPVVGVELARPVHGRAAVRALGDDLDDAARLNDQRPAELRALLLTDPTAWLDTEARIYFKDDAPATAPSAATVSEVAPYPLDQTFLLHSKSGSQRTIYLDFDGHTVSGTQWNSSDGVSTAAQPPWSLDGTAAFNDAEREAIQSVWQRVAEDYAPFDVDVTTQDPGAAAIARTNAADQVYGTRALITPSTQAHNAICGAPPAGGCGGVAFLDVFDETAGHEALQPAWIFPHQLGNDAKNIAEAVSHEVGHNLSLEHDGRTNDGSGNPEEYYSGHGIWAPIMGGGYDAPIVQWSKGDYLLASNHQDDLAAITSSGLAARTDEAGGTVGTAATTLPTGTAYVSTRTDVDVYALGTCTGSVSVAGLNAPTSPDLDLQLRLLNQLGVPVATADPVSAAGAPARDVTTGTDATVSASLVTGTYFVEVDGVDNGSWVTQYDDYGSLGAYTLALTGTCGDVGDPEPGAPGAPVGVAATADATAPSVTVTWAAPGSDGGSPVTGYTVSGSPGGLSAVLGAAARSTTFTNLSPGTTYTFTVAATNAVGTGATSSASAVTAEAPGASVPSAPLNLLLEQRPLDGAIDVWWSEPADDGGSARTKYVLTVNGTPHDVPAGWGGAEVTGLVRGTSYDFSVLAVNEVGAGPAASDDLVLTGAPPAPVGVDLTVSGTTGTAVWGSPTGYDPALVTGWQVQVVVGGTVLDTATTDDPELRSLEYDGLPNGQVRFDVAALSGDLIGATASSPVRTVGPPPVVIRAPAAPRVGAAFAGRKGQPLTAGVRWTAPTSTGGAAVTGYQVLIYRLNAKGKVARTLSSAALGAGLRSAEFRLASGRYRFAVRARNSVGFGPLSAASKVVQAR